MSEDTAPLFTTKEEYKGWIDSQDWYQTIELQNGLVTPGRFPTHKRIPALKTVDFEGKSVLDIGCNSGQNSLLAKAQGASKVVGVDVDARRLKQAGILARNEGLDVTFLNRSIFDLNDERFDVVLCIAVLTEIPNFFEAVEKLKRVIGDYALLELDLAKPLLYLSFSKHWLRGHRNLSRRAAVSEVRELGDGRWVISPSFKVLQALFGDGFQLRRRKGGIRYDLVEVRRVVQPGVEEK